MSDRGLISGDASSATHYYGSTMSGAGGGSNPAHPAAGPSSTATFFDEPHFNRLCDTITANIYTIAKSGTNYYN